MLFRSARRCALISIAVTNLLTAQSMGSSGSVVGMVTDPSGATVAGATVSIENPVSHFKNQAKTDASGSFKFNNVPFSHYHIAIDVNGFQPVSHDADVRSSVPITINVKLVQLAVAESMVIVSADVPATWWKASRRPTRMSMKSSSRNCRSPALPPV